MTFAVLLGSDNDIVQTLAGNTRPNYGGERRFLAGGRNTLGGFLDPGNDF